MHAQLPKPLATHPPSPHHTVTRGKTQGAGKPSCESPLPSKPGVLFSIRFPRKRRSFCCYKKPSQPLASSREQAQKVPAHVVRARRAAGSQRGGSSWETFTNLDICSLKLPSDSWDREGSAFTAPQRGRGWLSYKAVETTHPVQGPGRGLSTHRRGAVCRWQETNGPIATSDGPSQRKTPPARS